MSKTNQKARLLKRLQKKIPPLSNFKVWKERFRDYIFEDGEDDEREQYKRINELLGHVNDLSTHLHTLKNTYSKPWERPKWADMAPKPGEYRKKTSRLFWKLYSGLWESTLTRKGSIEITERLDLPQADNGGPLVIVIPDIGELALKYKTTTINIYKLLGKWSAKDPDEATPDAPLTKLKMTDQKNKGGKSIYAIGYWTEFKKVPFFTKDRSEAWLREILFRKTPTKS